MRIKTMREKAVKRLKIIEKEQNGEPVNAKEYWNALLWLSDENNKQKAMDELLSNPSQQKEK